MIRNKLHTVRHDKSGLTNRGPKLGATLPQRPTLGASCHFAFVHPLSLYFVSFHAKFNFVFKTRVEWYYATAATATNFVPQVCVDIMPFSSHSLSVDGSVFSFIADRCSELKCRIAALLITTQTYWHSLLVITFLRLAILKRTFCFL